MILVMLLLVLTIVRGTGSDVYIIFSFEGRGGGGRFVPPSNKRLMQNHCQCRQCRFVVYKLFFSYIDHVFHYFYKICLFYLSDSWCFDSGQIPGAFL